MIIEKTLDGIKELLEYRRAEIEKIAINKGSYSIAVKNEAGAEAGAVQIRPRLNLVPERIKDETIRVVNAKQLPLGIEGRKYNMGGKGA